MKKTLTLFPLAALLLGTASAQGAVLPTTDPSQLGGDVTMFAATLLFIVQFIKRQFERQGRPLRWYVTLAVTLILGEGLAALLFYSGYGARFGSAAPPMAWILFGLVGAAIAAGLKDFAVSLMERGRSTTTVVQTAPAPAAAVPAAPAPVDASGAGFVPGEDAPADIRPLLGLTAFDDTITPDPSLLPGFQADTVEDVLRATGEWPAVPGLER